MKKKDTRSRKWKLVINNPATKNMKHEQIKEHLGNMNTVYWCMCDEIGEQGTYHTDLFFMCANPIRFTAVKSKFPEAHIEMANGTPQQNRDYTKKEGKWAKSKKKETNLPETFEESGDCPEEKQGKRSDLQTLYELIKEGKEERELYEINPNYARYANIIQRFTYIHKYEKHMMSNREMPVEYIWGETGAGKTTSVYETFGYRDIYRITDYTHPWDGYNYQPVVVFDEFRSQVPITDMNYWLGEHPSELRCRYQNKIAAYEKVIVLANIPIDHQYRNIQTEYPALYDAFYRRFTNIEQIFRPSHLPKLNLPPKSNPYDNVLSIKNHLEKVPF